MSSLLRLFICIHIYIQCIPSFWFDLANLPTWDSGMAVGSYNGSIYLIGGSAGSHTQFTEYSIDLNTFTSIEPSPLNFAVYLTWHQQFWTQQEHIVYIINGATSIAAFDFTTQTHSTSFTSTPNNAGQQKCLTSSMDYLYVTGGQYGLELLQVMQISTAQWTVSNNRMNTGRRSHSCIVHDSFLYVFGGFGTTWTSTTERVDTNQITSNDWEYSVTLLHTVQYSRAVSCGDKLFVLGGRSRTGRVNSAQLIDPLHQTILLQTMPYTLDGMGTICFGQNIYVFGGRASSNHVFYYTEFTDAPTNNPTFPSVVPSRTPHQANGPSVQPTIAPSDGPSVEPTIAPIDVETTEQEDKGKSSSDQDGPAKAGAFDGFSSSQVILVVVLIVLTVILVVVLIVLVVVKRKTEEQIKEDMENMEKQQRSIYGEQEGNDDDGTTVEDKNDNAFEGDLGKVRSEPNEDDILAQVLALSLAEEEEAREKEQMEMMKQIKIMKQIEEEQERKRQGQIESEQVKDHDDNAGSLPESVHESIHDSDTVSLPGSEHDSDDEVLKTDKITTDGNDGIVDEYKQDVEDVMDAVALNGGMVEQSGIGLASDSDEDVLVGGDITVGSAASKPVLQEEVMFDTGDLPESDNSDDDVLVGENIGTTRTGGGDGSIALPGQPTLGLNGEDQALPSTSTAQSGE
eukprot:155042_1